MPDWDWDGEDAKETVVVPQVLAIAVYRNEKGAIVLRQEAMVAGEDDSVIVVPQAYVAAVVNAINDHTDKDAKSPL